MHFSCFRGVGYPSLWPSATCKEPLDVSNDFTFKLIDGILSGYTLSKYITLILDQFSCQLEYNVEEQNRILYLNLVT
jgi:hypothetical protein